MAENTVLRVEGLSKSFRSKQALDRVSFAMPEASLTVLLGPAGAGKTTTLRCIAGLDQPDAGSISICGRDVSDWEPKDRDVAMILDSLALYPDKTGLQNIASPLRIRGLPWDEIEKQAQDMANMLKISHVLNRLPKTMSGGERQRVALGRALVRSPRLFLLDEPLSSLDAMLRIELRAEIRRLQRERGYSFLLATPDFNEALTMADTVIMLREGRIVQMAEPQTVYDHPVDREVASFVGAPQINLLPAVPAPERDGSILAAAGRLPASPELAQTLAARPAAFTLGVRPENLALADPDAAPIRAALVDVETLGMRSVLTLRNDAAELRMMVEGAQARGLKEGEVLGVAVADPSRLLAFDAASGQRLAAP